MPNSPTSGYLSNILPDHYFSVKNVTPVEVYNSINELKISSGPGLDGIEAKFLQLSSHDLLYPLCDTFNPGHSIFEQTVSVQQQ